MLCVLPAHPAFIMQSPTSKSSPKVVLRKLSYSNKNKAFRIMVLGQASVGKTALTVRFITKRFIGEYDPTLEKVYTHKMEFENDYVMFEILDTAGQESDSLLMQENIRWADAFILLYSVTDKCSFDECVRLKFLINHAKRKKKGNCSPVLKSFEASVFLVGNKNDLFGDRMVSKEEGKQRSKEIGCLGFHEISVRESVEEVREVFDNLYNQWKLCVKNLEVIKKGTNDFQTSCESIFRSLSRKNRKNPDRENIPTGSPVKPSTSLDETILYKRFQHPQYRVRASTDTFLATWKNRCSMEITKSYGGDTDRDSVRRTGSLSGQDEMLEVTTIYEKA